MAYFTRFSEASGQRGYSLRRGVEMIGIFVLCSFSAGHFFIFRMGHRGVATRRTPTPLALILLLGQLNQWLI